MCSFCTCCCLAAERVRVVSVCAYIITIIIGPSDKTSVSASSSLFYSNSTTTSSSYTLLSAPYYITISTGTANVIIILTCTSMRTVRCTAEIPFQCNELLSLSIFLFLFLHRAPNHYLFFKLFFLFYFYFLCRRVIINCIFLVCGAKKRKETAKRVVHVCFKVQRLHCAYFLACRRFAPATLVRA